MRNGKAGLYRSKPDADFDRSELRRLRGLFRHASQLVSVLEKKPGFENINLSTIYRWCADVTIPLPRRAHRAIQILRSELIETTSAQVTRLRIAHHVTELATSAFLAYSPRLEQQTGLKTSVLATYNACAEHIKTQNGTESLDRLAEKAADMALAHAGLLRPHHIKNGCRQLCLVATALASAVASRRVKNPYELREMKFGFPVDTFIENSLSETLRRLGCLSHEAARAVQPCDNPRQAAKLLLDGKIHCIVAWKEWVDTARGIIPGKKCHDVPGSFFPSTEFAAYANLECADPTAVRAFLAALRDVTRELSDSAARRQLSKLLKQVPEGEFENHLGMPSAKVQKTIASRSAAFVLAEFDPETMLDLWQVEALHAAV